MTRQQILESLKLFARMNGHYYRLLETVIQMKELPNFITMLEEQNFKDEVELILFLDEYF